ncbi:MAG: response regulator transcription factor, partial [Dehalococcoidia bacterium]
QARATVEMQRARDWAAERGYAVEEAAASLQMEKMAALFSGRAEHSGDPGESAAHEFLLQRGFDPWPHSAAVESAALAGAGNQPGLLTPRELATLKLLANDVSYKDAGNEMSISWQTVRSTARSIYQKLGVTSKHQAAEEARRLGLL